MDFAKDQLMKYGWKQGQGLGKDETGIKEPIQAKVKHNKFGVGHDVGKEFSFHWWDHVFNKTASSIQVETTENGVQVKKADPSSKRTKKSTKTYDNKALMYDKFVKGATLSDGRYKAEEKVEEADDSDHEQPSKSSVIPANEEELFRRCGGRTAHKGARHGLKLNGKLSRIQQQEEESFNRMTEKSANQNAENNSLPSRDIELIIANGTDIGSNVKSKKKKRKIAKNSASEMESAEKLEKTDEPQTKTCKKKRKKDKHKANWNDSLNHQSETVNVDSETQAENEDEISLKTNKDSSSIGISNNCNSGMDVTLSNFISYQTDRTEGETISKKMKKKKKKKDKE